MNEEPEAIVTVDNIFGDEILTKEALAGKFNQAADKFIAAGPLPSLTEEPAQYFVITDAATAADMEKQDPEHVQIWANPGIGPA
jgi:hypothetical protein